MEKIIFGIVLLHILAGFGWIVYKLQFQKKKPNDECYTDVNRDNNVNNNNNNNNNANSYDNDNINDSINDNKK